MNSHCVYLIYNLFRIRSRQILIFPDYCNPAGKSEINSHKQKPGFFPAMNRFRKKTRFAQDVIFIKKYIIKINSEFSEFFSNTDPEVAGMGQD